jgi:hypothetical protein
MQPLTLTADELKELTGYQQRTRQVRWLREVLKIDPPRRADGLAIVTRAQLEAAIGGARPEAANGPRWSK